MTKSVYKLQMK
uniref:Uncharacterized protein n=1 Tax=Anguilla anguilla TaxID=7936 RepID=A0A0E9W4E1_ANGAN